MLSGRRPFVSDEVSDALAFILTKDPEWAALPTNTPAPIRILLRRCLEKDRNRRLADVADARFQIEDALAAPAAEVAAVIPTVPPRRHMVWRAPPWVAAALTVAAAGMVMMQTPTPEGRPLVRITAEAGADVVSVGAGGLDLSPDGSMLVLTAQPAGGATSTAASQLYVRRLDQLRAMALACTEGAARPFFSPDGRWVAFFAAGKLKKTSVDGGAVVTLCDAPGNSGGEWTEDGTIVFQPAGNAAYIPGPLLRVPESGGQPQPLVAAREAELAERWPQRLPGGRAVLSTIPATTTQVTFNDANIVIQALPAGERKVVAQGYFARYLSSGHLVYIHDSTLFATPFDLDRLELTGPSVPAVEGIGATVTAGHAQYSVSTSGTLAYVPGQGVGYPEAPIHWMHRSGKTAPLRPTPSVWGWPSVSPDGRRLALAMADSRQNADIWIYEWDRDTLTRLTTDPASDVSPVWTPDGQRIAFASQRADGRTYNLYLQRADGTGGPQRLTDTPMAQLPYSWHPSGRLLAFHDRNLQSGEQNLMILPMEGDETSVWKPGKPSVFLGGPSPAVKTQPAFSPDGR